MARKYIPTSNNIVVRHVAKANVTPADLGPWESEVLAVGPLVDGRDPIEPGMRVVYNVYKTLDGSEVAGKRLVKYTDVLAIVVEDEFDPSTFDYEQPCSAKIHNWSAGRRSCNCGMKTRPGNELSVGRVQFD